MADVVISYAPENEATARQLAEAVARDGYTVWHAAGGASDADNVTDEIAAAKAVVVIWSEAASSSEWLRAEANVARGMKKLVQLSADGRPPPVPFDPAQVISVLTWRGDADHPAWRGIRARLAELCGPATAPPAAPPEVPAPAPPVDVPPPPAEPAEPSPPPAEPESTSTPSKGPGALVIIIVVAVILAVLIGAAFLLMRSREDVGPAPSLELNMTAPDSNVTEAPSAAVPAGADEAVPAPAAPEEQFDRQAVIRGANAVPVRSAPSAKGFTIARVNAGEVFTTYQQTGDWWRVRTADGRTGYLPAANVRLRDAGPEAVTKAEPQAADRPERTERRAEQRPRRGPRIRKENSEVMAAFCEGAGRGTPQCRRFQQSY